MNLLPQLVVRLFGITVLCLAVAIAWIVVDAHRSIEREAELSAALELWSASPDSPLGSVCQALLNLNEFQYVE